MARPPWLSILGFLSLVVLLRLFWYSSKIHPAAQKTYVSAPGSYLVVLKPASNIDAHLDTVLAGLSSITGNEKEEMTIEMYQMGSFSGYHALLTEQALSVVKANDDVAFMEPDYDVEVLPTAIMTRRKRRGDEWGLGAVSQIGILRSAAPAKHNSTAYVLSSGLAISSQLPQATLDFSVVTGPSARSDIPGHGTSLAHVLSTISPYTRISGVKVLNDRGHGTVSGVISGLSWVMADAHNRRMLGMSVLVLAIGDVGSKALDVAISAAAEGGMVVFQAASSGGGERTVLVGAAENKDGVVWKMKGAETAAGASLYAPATIAVSLRDIRREVAVEGVDVATTVAAGVGASLLSGEGPKRPEELKRRMEVLAEKRGGTVEGVEGRLVHKGVED